MKVTWKGDMRFEAVGDSGRALVMDTHPDLGGTAGPTPVEALMASLAACSAMDVVSILKKKKQDVTDYWVEVQAQRGPEGVYPRPITKFTVKHVVKGNGLDAVAVARSIELSEEKYCTVLSTLRLGPELDSSFEIRED